MRAAILFNFLTEANIMASLAILLMLLLRKTLRAQLGNTALCFGWLLVAVRLLCPLTLPNPLINLIRTPYMTNAAVRPIAGQIQVRLHDLLTQAQLRKGIFSSSDPIYRAKVLLDNDSGRSYRLLAMIWLGGAAIVLLWAVIANLRFRAILRKAKIEPISGALRDDYEALCRELSIKPLSVMLCDPLPSACLVGLFRPVIALPLSAERETAVWMLRHELFHRRHWDHVWNAVRIACCALHWFNPLVWLAARMSRTDAELRCDDAAVSALNACDKQAYADTLVRSVLRRVRPGLPVLATGMSMTGRQMKRRVSAVLRGRPSIRWLSVAFSVLAVMLLGGAFSTAQSASMPRFLREHPAINRQAIQTEEEACAYAGELLSLPAFYPKMSRDADYDAQGELRQEAYPYGWMYFGEDGHYDPVQYWNVTLTEGQSNLYLLFDMDGNLNYLSFDGKERDIDSPTTVYLPEESRMDARQAEQLKRWAMDTLNQVNPKNAAQTGAIYLRSEYTQGGVRYADLVGYDTENAREYQRGNTFFLSVRLDDMTVAYYNRFQMGEDGNG